jgi:quinol monooxygenase YgiN
MIVVAATLRFADREARDAAVADSVALQRATREEEPGCLAYAFAADPVDQDAVQVYELWTDEAALAAHFEHANYHAMRQLLRRYPRGSGTSAMKFRCDLTEPVYDAEGVPRAGFSATAGP